MNPSEREIYRRTESGLVIFPAVYEDVDPRLKDKQLALLEQVQQVHNKQRQIDLFPPDSTVKEREQAIRENPSLGRNNVLTRWRGEGKNRSLVPRSYRHLSFRGNFDEIAKLAKRLERVGKSEGDWRLEREAQIIRESFGKNGNTDQGMVNFLEMKSHPRFSLFSGLLDRTARDPRKYYFQGWSQIVDPDSSLRWSNWARSVLEKSGRVNRQGYPVYVDLIFGDSAIQAGRAADVIWQGNALPSQPEIANEHNFVICFFDNACRLKTRKYVLPVFKETAPMRRQENIDEKLMVLMRPPIIAHEVQHAKEEVPEDAVDRLLDMYQPLRESSAGGAEHLLPFTHYRDWMFAREDADELIYAVISRAQGQIRRFRADNPGVGEIYPSILEDPYPFCLAAKLHWLEDQSIIERNSNGHYRLRVGNSEFIAAMEKYMHTLQEYMFKGSRNQVEDFIYSYNSDTFDFFSQAA